MGDPEKLDLKQPTSVAPSYAASLDDDLSALDVEKSPETQETLAETPATSSSVNGENSKGETAVVQEASAAKAGTEEDDEIEYPKASKLAFITIALMLSVSLHSIDTMQIINVNF